MADVVLTQQKVVTGGLAPSYTTLDAVDTYYAPNVAGKSFLHFKNTNAGAATVTFDITKKVQARSIVDPTVSIPASTGDVMVGPFPALWEEASGTQKGRVKFTQDLATGVTVALVRI